MWTLKSLWKLSNNIIISNVLHNWNYFMTYVSVLDIITFLIIYQYEYLYMYNIYIFKGISIDLVWRPYYISVLK